MSDRVFHLNLYYNTTWLPLYYLLRSVKIFKTDFVLFEIKKGSPDTRQTWPRFKFFFFIFLTVVGRELLPNFYRFTSKKLNITVCYFDWKTTISNLQIENFLKC